MGGIGVDKKTNLMDNDDEDEEYDYGIYQNQQLFNAEFGEGGRYHQSRHDLCILLIIILCLV